MLRESRRWELPEWRNACPANRPAGSVAPLVELIVQLAAATWTQFLVGLAVAIAVAIILTLALPRLDTSDPMMASGRTSEP